MAKFLGLDSPESYTGHCWRRTAATNAADNGASEEDIKLIGHWKSAKVAKSYVDDSVAAMTRMARLTTPRPFGADTGAVASRYFQKFVYLLVLFHFPVWLVCVYCLLF